MKKVLGSMAGILFAVFCVAVLGLLMSFTLGALRKLFPDNFSNQMWGLVLFDIAAMVWALVFVFKSQSVGQYAAAGIGFVTAFAGTLLMVAAEVILSGQTFVTNNDIGRWMVYGFIIVTAVHAALVYFHHAASPDIHEKINVGIARGEITTEAIRQATTELEAHKAALAHSIHTGIVDQVKRDLGLPTIAVDPTVGFVPVPVDVEPQKKEQTVTRWYDKIFRKKPAKKYEQTASAVNTETGVKVPQDVFDELREKYPADHVLMDNVRPEGKGGPKQEEPPLPKSQPTQEEKPQTGNNFQAE